MNRIDDLDEVRSIDSFEPVQESPEKKANLYEIHKENTLKADQGMDIQKWLTYKESGELMACKVSKDGSFVCTTNYDNELNLYDVSSGQEIDPIFSIDLGFENLGNCLAWTPLKTISQFAVVDSKGVIRVFDATKKKESFFINTGTGEPLLSLDFRPDCRLMATGNRLGSIFLYDYAGRRLVREFNPASQSQKGHRNRVTCLKYNKTDPHLFITCGFDHMIREWDDRMKEVRIPTLLTLARQKHHQLFCYWPEFGLERGSTFNRNKFK